MVLFQGVSMFTLHRNYWKIATVKKHTLNGYIILTIWMQYGILCRG